MGWSEVGQGFPWSKFGKLQINFIPEENFRDFCCSINTYSVHIMCQTFLNAS